MPYIFRSGSKITVIVETGGCAILLAIAKIVHTAIQVGNQYVGSSISFSEKFWPAVRALLMGQ